MDVIGTVLREFSGAKGREDPERLFAALYRLVGSRL